MGINRDGFQDRSTGDIYVPLPGRSNRSATGKGRGIQKGNSDGKA